MISKYIERHIKRKILLLDFFFDNVESDLDISYLLEMLNVTKPTFFKDISIIQESLGNSLEITFHKYGKLHVINRGISYSDALSNIYRQSDFLNILGFFLVRTSNMPFQKYIDKNFYSRAKAYAVKKKVYQYFRESNLTEENELKKTLLIAKLEVEYGIPCLPKYICDLYKERMFCIINKSYFLSFREKQMFCQILMTLIGKKKKLDILKYFNSNLILNVITIPEKEQFLFKELNELWKSEKDINYKIMLFFYKVISTNIYFPSLMSELELSNLIVNAKLNNLLKLFEKEFGSRLVNDRQFLGVFFNCIKCLSLESSEFLLCKDSKYVQHEYYYRVLNLFIDWEQKYEDGKFLINTECLNYLANRISTILKKEEKLKVYIYTDSFLEYIEMFQDLKKYLKVEVEIVDFWLYTPLQFPLIKGDNKIIVTNIQYLNTIFSNEKNIYFLKFPMTVKDGNNFNNYLLEQFKE